MSDSKKKFEEMVEEGHVFGGSRVPPKSLDDYLAEQHYKDLAARMESMPMEEKLKLFPQGEDKDHVWKDGSKPISGGIITPGGDSPYLSVKYRDTNKLKKDGGGLRYNEDKLRYDLQHPQATKGLVRVLTKGAKKYAPRNWERGMKWSDVLQSLKRHLAAIESGEDYDSETGELHIDHLQCNAHFLSAYYKIFPQGDDRAHAYLDETKIGLDIDEVLADWLGAWRELHGITDEPTSWWFDRNLMKKFDEMAEAGTLDDFYLGLKPIITPMDIPFEPHCYITSRPVSTEISERWLDMHGFPAKPVFTTTKERTKVVIAKEQGLDMFVDDSFTNFRNLNEAGICTFLMDRPHNHRHEVGFKRITKLSDFV